MVSETTEDGTPVADLQAELQELKAEMAEIKKGIRAIVSLCDAPHWTAARRWDIRDRGLKLIRSRS